MTAFQRTLKQQAIALDCSGVLANLSKQTMEWETV
jgi:hypothetical protein